MTTVTDPTPCEDEMTDRGVGQSAAPPSGSAHAPAARMVPELETGPSPSQRADLQQRALDLIDRRRQNPPAALMAAEALRDEAVQLGDDVALCRALTVAGAAHHDANDFTAALRALLEALSVADNVPDADRARVLSEAGHLDGVLGESALGTEKLFDALRIYEDIGDLRGQADTLNRIGVAFFSHHDHDEALRAYERSLALREELDDDLSLAGVRNNLAKVLTERGDYELALEHLRAARTGFDAAGERRGLGMTFHNAAVVNIAIGDFDRAVEQLWTSIEHYDVAGHIHGACEARTRLGKILTERGELDTALELLERSHRDAQDRGLIHECADAAGALVDLHERRESPAEALVWLRQVRSIERSLFNDSSELRLRSLQVRYQLERAERDSITDSLTQLMNRRGLDRVLADAVARSREDGSELAVLLLDLDNFKQVNDRFSHSVGDQVLEAVAEVLRRRTRPTDVCARYGGEEFVVVLPNCTAPQAHKVGEELCEDLRRRGWSDIAPELEVTTSIGVAVLSTVTGPTSLLMAADRALYGAKHAGKDQVR